MYFDSGSATRKDYTNIKTVLEDALTGFAHTHGPLRKQTIRRGKVVISHQTEFPCVKQPANNLREAYYAIHHMREFLTDQQQLLLPSSLRAWRPDLANGRDDDLRLEISRIQQKIAQLIMKDVCSKEGICYHPLPLPTNAEIEDRLEMQCDHMKFNTLGGVRMVPPRSSQKK